MSHATKNKNNNKQKTKQSDDEVKLFSLEGHEVWASVASVYDGDTITAIFPMPLIPDSDKYKWKCRLAEIDTNEIRGTQGEEKALAIEARDWLRGQILHTSVKLQLGKFDKYGRVLVHVLKPLENGEFLNINKELVRRGLAKVYP